MVVVRAGEKAFGLLSGHVFTASEDTSRNAQSPLLSLPAEIKNKIYGFVLGGRALHCFPIVCEDDRSSPTSNDCQLHTVDCGDCKRFAMRAGDKDYITHHDIASCNYGRDVLRLRKGDPFSMLKVCQQLYHETALLPLELSTFHFFGAMTSSEMEGIEAQTMEIEKRLLRDKDAKVARKVAAMRATAGC